MHRKIGLIVPEARAAHREWAAIIKRLAFSKMRSGDK